MHPAAPPRARQISDSGPPPIYADRRPLNCVVGRSCIFGASLTKLPPSQSIESTADRPGTSYTPGTLDSRCFLLIPIDRPSAEQELSTWPGHREREAGASSGHRERLLCLYRRSAHFLPVGACPLRDVSPYPNDEVPAWDSALCGI
jgi:hypothetical protein